MTHTEAATVHEHTSDSAPEDTEAESTTRRFPFTLPDFGTTAPQKENEAA